MTKYILAGGCDRQYRDFGIRLAEVIKRELNKPPVILSCLFAQAPALRPAKHKDFDAWFADKFGGDTQIIHGSEQEFFEQLKLCDVLYLHGGTTVDLLKALPDFDRVKAAMQGKIVVGSSAGANYLSKICYSPSKDAVVRGGGILDVNVIVHYGIERFDDKTYSPEQWQDAIAKVKEKVTDNTPLLLLPEGNFAIFES